MTAADIQIVKGKAGYESVLADDARALIRGIVYPDLIALRDAARAAEHPLVIVSAYRSYEQQELTRASAMRERICRSSGVGAV